MTEIFRKGRRSIFIKMLNRYKDVVADIWEEEERAYLKYCGARDYKTRLLKPKFNDLMNFLVEQGLEYPIIQKLYDEIENERIYKGSIAVRKKK